MAVPEDPWRELTTRVVGHSVGQISGDDWHEFPLTIPDVNLRSCFLSGLITWPRGQSRGREGDRHANGPKPPHRRAGTPASRQAGPREAPGRRPGTGQHRAPNTRAGAPETGRAGRQGGGAFGAQTPHRTRRAAKRVRVTVDPWPPRGTPSLERKSALQLPTRGDAQLSIDLAEVVVDRAGTDEHLSRNFRIGRPS
jgi:hypothetical protein